MEWLGIIMGWKQCATLQNRSNERFEANAFATDEQPRRAADNRFQSIHFEFEPFRRESLMKRDTAKK
jgi:hypothetical protein